MGFDESGAQQVSILVLGAAMVAVGYLGLTHPLTAMNVGGGGGAVAIALLAYNLGRYRTDTQRA